MLSIKICFTEELHFLFSFHFYHRVTRRRRPRRFQRAFGTLHTKFHRFFHDFLKDNETVFWYSYQLLCETWPKRSQKANLCKEAQFLIRFRDSMHTTLWRDLRMWFFFCKRRGKLEIFGGQSQEGLKKEEFLAQNMLFKEKSKGHPCERSRY